MFGWFSWLDICISFLKSLMSFSFGLSILQSMTQLYTGSCKTYKISTKFCSNIKDIPRYRCKLALYC